MSTKYFCEFVFQKSFKRDYLKIFFQAKLNIIIEDHLQKTCISNDNLSLFVAQVSIDVDIKYYLLHFSNLIRYYNRSKIWQATR